MQRPSQIQALRIFPLAIPLRKPFEHAAHTRQTADPVVVEIELADGTLGYGETLARPYVTGETSQGVVNTIQRVLVELLLELRPASFPDALESIDALPCRDPDGAVITASRAAVELALLDAYSRHFGRPISEAAGWLGLGRLGPPGSINRVAYSAIASGRRTAGLARKVRMMYWYGLRDFKLKVGYEDDADRVAIVCRTLGRSLGRTTTLRIDANAGWTLEQALARLKSFPLEKITCVEQPLARIDDEYLSQISSNLPVAIMPDESLVTMDDAQRLANAVGWFNIRISKNGGLLPALRLAHFALHNGLKYQLGCMVGETSILSAAGRRFLENAPETAFAEGSYGRFLLAGDIADRPCNFGCGGRVKSLPGLGWGVQVNPDLLRRHAATPPIEIRF